ncbi:mRNA cleavage and polyadenylation factor CLP1 p-loop domain-containing protein [Ditylenchus destructor]|nr:mRNA cleavage and polyadenylation factor CLP1 p-loop domain-containing protein [Ditylenchus destructor]
MPEAAPDGKETKPPVAEYKLDEDNELRIEVGNEDVVLELLEGAAEVFGTPLSVHKRYTLPQGFRAAVFTYKNALIEVVGKTESAYVAQQTPMVMYLNAHYALETMRQKAEEELTKNANTSVHGPRLMVAGPTDVGKSTLCRILCNYAVRQNRTPILVDVDVGQNSITVPGAIGAIYIEKSADIVDNFDTKAAYVFNFGYISPSSNIVLYDLLVKELAAAVNKRSESSLACNFGGVIINTCGWIRGDGYTSIVNTAEAFMPDVVIVLDHERLYNDLQKDLSSDVKILHFPKSGGVETRSREVRRASRDSAVHKNFYGTKNNPFFPHSFEISYDKPQEEQELIIAKIGAERLPDSCLPYGMKIEDHRTMVVPVPISNEITNHLLALMPPESTIDQGLLKKPCLGYIAVTNVDTINKTITILSPQPYPLPSRLAVLSELTFTES